MKKWAIILSIIILTTITYSISSIESDYYVKSVPIFRIYHHSKGFVVLYEKQNMDVHRIYLPYAWFQVPDKTSPEWKAEVIYGNGFEYPYMNIYWNRSGFSHVRLFLHDNKSHSSWGSLRNQNQFDNSFDIEQPVFEF